MGTKIVSGGTPQVHESESEPVGGVLSRNTLPFSQFEGFVRNPEKISIEQLEVMMRTDETVSAMIEFLIMAVVKRMGTYVHQDDSIQEFVRMNLDRMRGSFKAMAKGILTATWAGFSVSEIVWMMSEGKVMLDAVHTLNPSSVAFMLDLSQGDRHGEVEAVKQWPNTSWETVIGFEKLVIYTHRKRFGNPYGNSRLQSAFKNWWMKDVILKSYTRAMERYGSPLIVGTTDGYHSAAKSRTGAEVTRGKAFLEILEDLHSSAAIVKQEGQAIEFVQPGRSVGGDFKDCLEYLNRMILRSGLIPSLIFDNTDTGSRALGETHMDILALSIEELVEEVSEAILEQLVKRLIFFNFGEQESWGGFTSESVKTDELEMWSKVLAVLEDKNYVSSGDLEDFNCIREKFGFDPRDEVFQMPVDEESFEPLFQEELRAELQARLEEAGLDSAA